MSGLDKLTLPKLSRVGPTGEDCIGDMIVPEVFSVACSACLSLKHLLHIFSLDGFPKKPQPAAHMIGSELDWLSIIVDKWNYNFVDTANGAVVASTSGRQFTNSANCILTGTLRNLKGR